MPEDKSDEVFDKFLYLIFISAGVLGLAIVVAGFYGLYILQQWVTK